MSVSYLPTVRPEADSAPDDALVAQANLLMIDEDVTVGVSSPLSGVRRLAWQGFAAVLDIRDIKNAPTLLSALTEAEGTADSGLVYAWRPLRRDDPGAIDSVLHEIQRLPKPLYVHDESLEAALAIGLIASDEFQSAGQVLARMAARGAPLLDEKLSASVRAWFQKRGLEPKAPETIVAFD